MSSIIYLLCFLVFVGVILTVALSAQAQMVGGTESAKGKWPFFAGVLYKRPKWFYAHSPHCGAVIWDKDTLLTAAHCFEKNSNHPELFDVYLGHNRWTRWKPRNLQYMFKVREIIIHPNFDWTLGIFDIALIFLDRSIDFNGINSKVQRVNHPEPLDYLDTLKCVTMGWGIDNAGKTPAKLMEVVLPILDNEICKNQDNYFVPDHHLCAGYVDPTVPTGTCYGDSGGPLVCPQKANPGTYSLVGITSFGGKFPNCGRKPDYFIKVELFEDWIASVHSKTRNVPKLGRTSSRWNPFKKRWFGRWFSNKGLIK